MILDTIDNIDTIKYIKRSPALQEAFEWFKNTPQDIEEGEYELRGKDLYIIVTSFDTQPREDCIFESHRAYVDVQFMVEGGEIIDWSPIKLLTPQDEYNEEGDYEALNKAGVAIKDAKIDTKKETVAVAV